MSNEEKLLSYLKRVTADLHQTRQRLRELENLHDPVVVIGMGCRYPGGASSPQQLWDLVAEGADVIGEFPTNRNWEADLANPRHRARVPGMVRRGGFLYDADCFDPHFFGISNPEATAIDPQQRLLLKVAWETIEHARIDPESLRGSRTGVYAGVLTGGDYVMQLIADGLDDVEMFMATGTTHAVASGRISYTLGLEGPAVSVDTACSSSLVAVHLAVQALRRGECDLALAGGASVMASPGMFLFTPSIALAEDGCCKAFAAAADGTGYSEGVGLVLLERLSDARANNHTIHAVIAGSAINQDGASNGLTAPNGPSQQRVIRAALADAGLTPTDIDAVEAHGTGTTLGDPIEAQALLATYGQNRPPDHPLYLGSIKSNIGHAAAAAGIAGLIKMIQAIGHGLLPQTLHIDTPTPHVDWTSGNITLLTEPRPWPHTDHPRRAAVSAFGLSGTNAHLIVEQPPAHDHHDNPATTTPAPTPVPWVLSAKTPAALADQASRLLEHLTTTPDADPVHIGWSLASTRTTFDHRAALTPTTNDYIPPLTALATNTPHPHLHHAHTTHPPKTAFVIPGQGSQRPGMGQQLYETSPTFRQKINDCADAFHPHTDWSLIDVLTNKPNAPSLKRVDITQPALFAMSVALAALWQAHGIHPTAIIGHSQGEIAAAHIAGGLTLDDAARIITLRCDMAKALEGRGGMLLVALPAEELAQRLREWGGQVSIAALNAPGLVSVTGDREAIEECADKLDAAGVFVRRIPGITIAGHSPQVDVFRTRALRDQQNLVPRTSDMAFYSTVTGTRVDTAELDADYWFRNARQPVLFEQGTRALIDDGYRLFIEASPHPVLGPAIQATLESTHTPGTTLTSLRRDHDDQHQFRTALTQAHLHGATPHWNTIYPHHTTTDLPTYPFHKKRYWPAPRAASTAGGHPGDRDEALWQAIRKGDIEALAGVMPLDAAQLELLAPALPALSAWRDAASWWHYPDWEPLPTGSASRLSGAYILLGPAGGSNDNEIQLLQSAISEAGGTPVVLRLGDEDFAGSLPTDRLMQALPVGSIPAGAVSLLGLQADTEPPNPAKFVRYTQQLAEAFDSWGLALPTWVVTRNACAESPTPASLGQAQLRGLITALKTAAPQRRIGLIDLPDTLTARVAGQFAIALAANRGDLLVRSSAVAVRRQKVALLGVDSVTAWRPGGTVLVVGSGPLVRHTARWLSTSGVGHVVVASDRGSDLDDAQLGRFATQISVLDGSDDITTGAAEMRIAAALEHHAVTAVCYAGLLEKSAPATAWALHRATEKYGLSAFILLSESADPSVPDEMIAAEFFAGLARYRRAQGLPAVAIQMRSPLASFGDPDLDNATTMPAEFVFQQLPYAANDVHASFTVAKAMPGDALVDSDPAATESDSALAALTELSPDGQHAYLLDLIISKAAARLGCDPSEIGADEEFVELGFSSINALALRNELQTLTGLAFSLYLILEYPTPGALAGYIRDQLCDEYRTRVMIPIRRQAGSDAR